MKLSHLIAALALAATVAVATLTSAANPAASPEPVLSANSIHVIEHPGYFETKSSIFEIESGTYEFVVDNRSGKDAGFVIAREGMEPVVIGIENGKTGRVEVELKGGDYSYYCPIIPTPHYPINVK